MKKVLFTATIDEHITSFHMNYIHWFQQKGYEVHVASNGSDMMAGVDKKFNIPFSREPIKKDSWEAYKALRKLVRHHNYDIVHCHTPMGAVLTRLATRSLRKDGVKVLYTAHGFHFYKGSPPINWVLYYPVEKLLSRYTDCLITINPEDYKRAQSLNFKAQSIKFVNGVGIDTTKFNPISEEEKRELRHKKGFKEEAFILTIVGELSNRKNQGLMIEAMRTLVETIPSIQLLLVGTGDYLESFKEKVKEYCLDKSVQFLGYRRDVDELMQVTDVSVTCSRQEGLPVNVMEAMATGLPVVATGCRGNRDLVHHSINGLTIELDDVDCLIHSIQLLHQHKALRTRLGKRGRQMIQEYSNQSIDQQMDAIYSYYIAQTQIVPELDVRIEG